MVRNANRDNQLIFSSSDRSYKRIMKFIEYFVPDLLFDVTSPFNLKSKKMETLQKKLQSFITLSWLFSFLGIIDPVFFSTLLNDQH